MVVKNVKRGANEAEQRLVKGVTKAMGDRSKVVLGTDWYILVRRVRNTLLFSKCA